MKQEESMIINSHTAYCDHCSNITKQKMTKELKYNTEVKCKECGRYNYPAKRSMLEVKENHASFTVLGQPPSKSNCYKIISFPGKNGKAHSSLAKTSTLNKYERDFFTQVPGNIREINLDSELDVELHCFFSSKRPDLDNAAKAILDCLQKAKVIKNDNLVYKLLMTKSIDKLNPRVEIVIREY